MNRVVLALIALAAIGAAALLLLMSPATEAVPVDGEAGVIEGSAAPEAASGPGLSARGSMGGPKRRDGESHRGGGAIVGTVRRAGKPIAARVDVTFVSEPNPFASSKRGGMASFFLRMLTAPTGAEKPVATAEAGTDGRFAAENLGVGIYEVRATVPDGARGVASATIPVDGARVEANPMVSAGTETLRGRVVHADGRPWKGVVVVDLRGSPNSALESAPQGRPIEVDAEGRFTETGLEPGAVAVNAFEGDTFRAVSKPITIPRAEEFVMTVDTAFVQVTGRVVAADDGSPIPNALVMSGGQGGELAMIVTKTTTDAEGRFELSMGTGERWGVFVTAAGFAGVMQQSVDPKVPLEIRMPRGARVAGRVTAEGDGRGVGGLTVTVQALDQRGSSFPSPPTTTEADGRYTATDLSAQESMVVAEGSGWATKGLRDVKPGGYNPLAVTLEAGKTVTMDVTVVRGCSATGNVLDAGGAPVAGAVVRAIQGGPNAMRTRSFPFDGGGLIAATRADGTFSIEGLVSGTAYDFTAEAPGRANASAGPLTAADAAPLQVELRFANDRWIDVTVLEDGSGAAVPGARVTVYGEAAARGGAAGRGAMMPPLTTGIDGKVRAGPVAPGAAQVSVEADGFVRMQQTRVAEADTAATIRLKRGLLLGGRVLMPDKTPAVGVSVRVEPIDYRNWNWVQPETTGGDGSFRFKSLSAGKVTVRASQSSGGASLEASAVATAGGEDVVLVLGPRSATSEGGGSLLVRVLDADGKPVARAEARFVTPNGTNGTNVQDGRVEFNGTRSPQGDGYVIIWNARGADGSPLPVGPIRHGPIAAGVSEVEVRLPPERRIEGVVKAPDGKAVRGVVVQATPVQPPGDRNSGRDWSGTSAPPARTDAGGAFRLSGLGDLDYTLTVKTPPEFAPADPVTARGGAAGVVIVLKAGITARVTVLDWNGSPVAGAFVTVGAVRPTAPDEEMRERSRREAGGAPGQTDAEGLARLEGLDPSAEYRLQVSSPQTRADLLPHIAEKWRAGDATIRLLRAFVVKGVVRDPGGRPVSGANVQRQTTPNSWRGAGTTGEDGAFSFNGLSAGDVVLRAVMDGQNGSQATNVTVQAGAENVVLTLDPGLDLAIRIDNWPSDSAQWQQASLSTTPAPGGGGGIHLSRQIAPDGTARFRGLTADATYTLWIAPVGDGLSLLERGMKAGRSEQRVRLVPGKTISGRLILPAGTTAQSVNASLKDSNVSVQGVVKPDGTYELRGLPDGIWSVSAWGRAGDVGASGRADVVAGGTADIELKPQSR